MTRSEFLFVLIDKLFDPSQNYRRYKNIVRKKDIVYSDRAPDLDTTAEVYYDPNLVGEGKPLLPVFVNIHGGGFVLAAAGYHYKNAMRYAKEVGCKVVFVNYRLAPQNPHPVFFEEENGISYDVPDATTIIVKGISKENVGEMAAKIRSKRPPEPYLGKGIKYDGEHIRRKAGKAGK